MQLLIESTDRGILFNGQLCQIWTGTTESGCEVLVYVRGLSAAKLKDKEWLEREVTESMGVGSIEAFAPVAPKHTS